MNNKHKYTKKENQDRFIEALTKNLGNITKATKSVGICRILYYQWLKSDEKFAERVKEIPDIQFDFVEGKLLQRIKEGSDQSIIFYLKTKGSKYGYGEKSSLDITSNNINDTTIKIQFIDNDTTFDENNTI